ncbi:MAG: hypothetical protein FD147_1386 [Chloroflexi bacterium]|nr:MAG: hypothetical protein FD147_1386 [Chloroflexota bacterium]
MLIKVTLIATFKMIAGQKSVSIELADGSTVRDAVDAIMKRIPALKPHWLNKEGKIQAHVHIFLNGDDVSTLSQGLGTVLVENDTLDFIPPVAGG